MNNEYMTLQEYRTAAKKIISKYISRYSGLKKSMMNNEDIISDVASSLMYADWKWDSDRVGKHTGKKKTKYSFRNQCAIWAIKTFLTSQSKKKKRLNILDINLGDDKEYAKNCIADHRDTEPDNDILTNEYLSDTKDLINQILSSNILTDKQKQQIKMYYLDEMTLAEIGSRFSITREAVRQNIKKGIQSIRGAIL